MGFSPVDISNRALQQLGVAFITTLDEGSKNARQAKTCYDALRQALYRDHRWSCATTIAQLAAQATPNPAPPDDFFVYTLPVDFIKLSAISSCARGAWQWDGSRFLENQDYFIQNGTLVTWAPAPMHLRYVFDQKDCNKMDPLFREALSASMSCAMAEALTQSNTKKATCDQWLKTVLARAKQANAFDNPAIESPEDDYILVRR